MLAERRAQSPLMPSLEARFFKMLLLVVFSASSQPDQYITILVCFWLSRKPNEHNGSYSALWAEGTGSALSANQVFTL